MVISETDFELLFENLSNKRGNNIWPNRLFEGMQLTYELYFLGLPKKNCDQENTDWIFTGSPE